MAKSFVPPVNQAGSLWLSRSVAPGLPRQRRRSLSSDPGAPGSPWGPEPGRRQCSPREKRVPWSSTHSDVQPYGWATGSVAVPPAARTRSTAAAMSSTRYMGTTVSKDVAEELPGTGGVDDLDGEIRGVAVALAIG